MRRTARAATPPQPEPASASASRDSGLAGLVDSLSGLTSDLRSTALRIADRTRQSAVKAISRGPEQLRLMATAGESLRDIREVAGMTVVEISEALNLRDKSFWEAVEDGREVLSFELILRLASLVARNDPLPFVLKLTRSYQPRLWNILDELGISQLPLQFERERAFINIYRRHDAARALSDAEFERVLRFTQDAFDLAIDFLAPPAARADEDRTAARAPAAGRKKRGGSRR
ncbi:MAG: helix-turn-helix domain-containing protein [Gammaproteobacteria bacterium]